MIVERLLKVALLGSSWVLYLLLALSVVSLTAALERWLYFRKHRDDLGKLQRELGDALVAEDLAAVEALLNRSRSLEARIVRPALWWIAGGPEAVSDAIDAELARAKKELERGLNLLGTLGNNAPFVGLLGTVIGVIEAFHQLGDAGKNAGAMGNVMSGIAEALVATGVGLFVALPAVVLFNMIQARVGEIETGVLSLQKMLTTFIRARDYQRGEVGSTEHQRAAARGENGFTRADATDQPKRKSSDFLAAE